MTILTNSLTLETFFHSLTERYKERTLQGQHLSHLPPTQLDTGLIGSRGILSVNDPFYDEGVFLIPSCEGGTCRFQNAGEAAYGDVDLRLALTYSSDVYFYNLAASFDILPGFDLESVQVAAKSFGYGSRTGVTLAGEGSGRIPTPASRRDAYRENPDAFLTGQWLTGIL